MECKADVLEDGGVVVGFGDIGELEEGGHGENGGERARRLALVYSLRFFGFLGWGVNV